ISVRYEFYAIFCFLLPYFQINSPSYMNFIRRNELGESFMSLSHDNLYQLLWPIPSSEMNLNPQMTQNPGY
ncbi:RagB/SusD family nutrient uptake outer membrane protein, partial [Phocaeicola plebeius]|uniref:RagB/SusD family nutrient uptake outer membrane protein n=1 Tax=Phocaeicola plebeius TaxID=310297 RepID=UPI00266C4476